MRHCPPAAALAAGKAPSISAMTGMTALDGEAIIGDAAEHQRHITSLNIVFGEIRRQAGVRRRRFAHDKQTRGVLVDAVDQAWTVCRADLVELRHMGKQRIDKRLIGMSGAGMHNKPRRLVDDD